MKGQGNRGDGVIYVEDTHEQKCYLSWVLKNEEVFGKGRRTFQQRGQHEQKL